MNRQTAHHNLSDKLITALCKLTEDELYIYQGAVEEAWRLIGQGAFLENVLCKIRMLIQEFDDTVCDYYHIIQDASKPRSKRSYRSLKGQQAACRRRLNTLSLQITDLQNMQENLFNEIKSAEPELLHRVGEQQ